MRYLLPFIIATFLFSCKDSAKTERGFYFWQQQFDLSTEQQAFLEDINAGVLYMHYFDVVMMNGKPQPIAEIELKSMTNLEIVPTVYITTDVFKDSSRAYLEDLAAKVAGKIKYIHGEKPLKEIQIDCDWTAGIQEAYFYFLEAIKGKFEGVQLSATVRLYQFKYPDISGVPPVDKGLLMYYNMGNLTDYETDNSILDNTIGKSYLTKKEYPLPLDVALPNFSWSLHFRSRKFEGIRPEFTLTELKNNPLFISDKENRFIFTKDTVMYGIYYRFGDELRYEACSEDELLDAAALLNERLPAEDRRILIYHLQHKTVKDDEKLDAVFGVFE